MKRTLFLTGLLLGLLSAPRMSAQNADSTHHRFAVGFNALAAIPQVVEPSAEVFFWPWLSLELGFGYAFPRSTRAMQNSVVDRVEGYFWSVGPRFYLFPQDAISPCLGLSYFRVDVDREIEATVPHYFSTYTESAQLRHAVRGEVIHLGLRFCWRRLRIEPAFRLTVIESRSDRFGYDYWTPGVGRAGRAFNARDSRRNYGFRAVLNLKIAL
ncbi:MAG: hypothetical protein AAGN35_09750 [Bacteroidota bacterium]